MSKIKHFNFVVSCLGKYKKLIKGLTNLNLIMSYSEALKILSSDEFVLIIEIVCKIRIFHKARQYG